jgi:hypothetical protein
MVQSSPTDDYVNKDKSDPYSFAAAITPLADNATVFSPAARGVVFNQSGTVLLEFEGTGGTPSAPIAGVSGDISVVGASNSLTSTTADKFDALKSGDKVTLSGFANAGNNGDFIVASAPVTGSTPSVALKRASGATAMVNETPAGTVAGITVPTRYARPQVLVTVTAGVMYPFSLTQWVTGGSGVTTGVAFW